MHPRERVDEVLRLVAAGWNLSQVSRATGVPWSTVQRWRSGGPPRSAGLRDDPRPRRGASPLCPLCHGEPLDEAAYAYLLGLYLGDGYILEQRRTTMLSIVQDARYADLIRLAARTIERVRGEGTRVSLVRKVGCVEICAWWKHWPCLFPQHGPGRKHERRIVLHDWQRRIVRSYPRQLVRGLLHSDGCRTTNRVGNGRYAYPRYLFVNTSPEILQVFRDACDALGIRYRNSKPNTISVARQPDVAALDRFVGPKS
ncbi:MAG TPA: helix-turn-helix domain-containing protein [Actinomycetota bacterium]|nr:helix-turn-helix domain-containing protein [Actinomycetota bacterium]